MNLKKETIYNLNLKNKNEDLYTQPFVGGFTYSCIPEYDCNTNPLIDFSKKETNCLCK